MSRLQEGGLALELITGEVVTLISFFGDGFSIDGKEHLDNWLVEFNQMMSCDISGRLSKTLYAQAKNLMPLGDKKTQDELLHELKLENV